MDPTSASARSTTGDHRGRAPCKDGKRRYKYFPYNNRDGQWTRCLPGCKDGWVRPKGHKMCEKKGIKTVGSEKVQNFNGGWLTASHIEFICEKWFKERKYTSLYRAAPYVEFLAEQKGTRNNRMHLFSDVLVQQAQRSNKVVFCIVNTGNSHWVLTAHTPTGDKFVWDSLRGPGTLTVHSRKGGNSVVYTRKQCPQQVQGWECGYHALFNLKTLIDNVNAKKGSPSSLDIDIDFRPSIHFIRNVQNAIYYDPKDGGDNGRLMAVRRPEDTNHNAPSTKPKYRDMGNSGDAPMELSSDDSSSE